MLDGSRRVLSKKSLVAVLLVLGACLVALFSVPSELYSSYVSNFISQKLASQGVTIRFTDFKIRGAGFHADQVSMFFPRALLTVDLRNTDCSISLLSIIKLKAGANCRGTIYGGKYTAGYQQALFSDAKAVTIDIDGLSVKEHPQIAGLGFTNGALSVKSPLLNIGADSISGAVELSGTGLERSTDTIIGLPGNSGFAPIPKFSNLNFHANLMLDPKKSSMNLSNFESSLGNASGIVDLIANGRQRTASGKMNISLSAESSKKYGQLLVIASKGILTPETRDFRISIDGNWPKINARVE